MPRPHSSLREGVALGLIVATIIWLWLALVDGLAHEPFRTFHLLGGVFPFTLGHYILCLVYGVVVVAVVHRAARAPALLVFAAFCFFILEFAFAMVTVLLSNVGLGELAWARILGGNVFGTVATFWLLGRRHPLKAEFEAAEREE